VVKYGVQKMTQKPTIAKAKTTVTKPQSKSVLGPKQTIVKAEKTKAIKIIPKVPKAEEVIDMEWMNWVEYAQAKLKYLENKLAVAQETIQAQKANIDRLNKRVMQG
jgi:hypothetical protein